MTHASASSLGDLVVMLVVGIVLWLIFVGIAKLIAKIAEWTVSARDELRDRYAERSWRPAAIDLLFVPIWLALEVLCLAVSLLFTVLVAVVLYQAAKDFRDWWHAGGRRDRR